MELTLDDEVWGLVRDYRELGMDESYFYHLANYLVDKLREQHPELWE